MTRRLLLFAVLLLAVTLPLSARRRAVTPGVGIPPQCSVGTLLPATYANLLASDDQFVYLIDESAVLARVPKEGGARQDLADPLDNWLPLTMEVDDTTVYISALPIESVVAPTPGVILAVPKSGGVVRVLVSNVPTAFDLALDAAHLYWAAAGLLDFDTGDFGPEGRVERIEKDGSHRQLLADGLSAPFSLVLDDQSVYFGETGLATGNATIGLRRVPKNGGTITPLSSEVFAGALALDGDTVVILGGTERDGFGLLTIDKAGSAPPQMLLADESLSFDVRVAGHLAYVIADRPAATELVSIELAAPGPATPVRSDVDGDAFLLDGCAAIVNTSAGDLVRTAR